MSTGITEEKLSFYLGNGFEENYSMVMETCIPDSFTYALPEDIALAPVNLNSDKELTAYKEQYDEIFVKPLELEALAEQAKQPHFHNLSFIKNGKLQGGCTLFAKDGCGYIKWYMLYPKPAGPEYPRL